MELSQAGLKAIIQREGEILHAYKDSVGVWTIGTGHTSAAGPPKVVPGMQITPEENDTILQNDLKPIENDLNKVIKVPVTQNQFDAIESITFNVGPKFYKSTAMKKLNNKDYKGAADAIMLWNKPPEIIGRRRSEQKQFLTPDPVTTTHASTAGTVIVAGGVAAAAAPYHYWPWILGGVVVALILGAIGVEIYRYKKGI